MADSDQDFLKSLGQQTAAKKPPAAPQVASPVPVPHPSAGPGPAAKPFTPPSFQKILAPLSPVINRTARVAGTDVGKVFDVLNRPSMATTSLMTHGIGPALHTLVHSESPEQYQKDTAEITSALMGGTPEEYANLPGWRRAANEMATQLITDPTTYIGGAGILEHLSEMGGAKALPHIYRAIEVMQKSKSPQVRAAGIALQKGHDFANFKGAQLRGMVNTSGGAQGIKDFRAVKSINNARRVHGADLSRQLIHQYHDVIQGLTPEQEGELYAAVHTGTVGELKDENLQKRAAAFKQVTDSLAHLSGDSALRTGLAKGFKVEGPEGEEVVGGGFELPQQFQRFDSGPRDMQGAASYRRDYVPTAHDYKAMAARERARGGIASTDESVLRPGEQSLEDILNNPAEHREPPKTEMSSEDKSLEQRDEGANIRKDPAEQRKVIEARLGSGAQAIAARDAEEALTKHFGVKKFSKVPHDAQEFFRETIDKPGAADLWRGLIDVPKVGLFALPFRHISNIASLAFLADPSLQNAYGTASRFAKLMVAGMDADKRAKILGPAYKYGVSGVPSIDRKAAGWIGNIPGIGKLYKLSNHTLWSFDDAAKASLFSRRMGNLRALGMTESDAAHRAADEVGAELIDYSNRSPLTKALANVAPFATYRSKLPGAIARSVTRHPERGAVIGRLSPELIGDEQEAPPNPQGIPQAGKSYLPLAEVLRGLENPNAYARSTLGWPAQMAASKLGLHGDDYPNYFTYGKDPGPNYIANSLIGSFPGGEAAMGALPHVPVIGPAAAAHGLGPQFKDQGDLSGTLRDQTGFGLTAAPTPAQIEAAQQIAYFQQAINAARAKNDADGVAFWTQKLAQYQKYHHPYEK